jgi:hypothetical protein
MKKKAVTNEEILESIEWMLEYISDWGVPGVRIIEKMRIGLREYDPAPELIELVDRYRRKNVERLRASVSKPVDPKVSDEPPEKSENPLTKTG